MRKAIMRPTFAYATTLDRAGLALAAGGGLAGLVVLLLVVASGERGAIALTVALLVGALFSMFVITMLAGPLWFVLHRAGYRRAGHAAALGALLAMLLFVAGQMLGLAPSEVTDAGRALAYRWCSAVATSALLAIVAAGIAAVMWRVAYRPVGEPFGRSSRETGTSPRR